MSLRYTIDRTDSVRQMVNKIQKIWSKVQKIRKKIQKISIRKPLPKIHHIIDKNLPKTLRNHPQSLLKSIPNRLKSRKKASWSSSWSDVVKHIDFRRQKSDQDFLRWNCCMLFLCFGVVSFAMSWRLRDSTWIFLLVVLK